MTNRSYDVCKLTPGFQSSNMGFNFMTLSAGYSGKLYPGIHPNTALCLKVTDTKRHPNLKWAREKDSVASHSSLACSKQ
ncbi:hypothetical protein Y1Q_0011464 [Alligator mississippiensis]|uniref:Uncharacterized protein n=1 Tax=Alligator mississippiensis TaxID=8496 RepID=A0A151LZU1_ALLMI|nr:hypothetical protein Y1Q_0011464 [Alligator mississippiensis]